MNTVGNEKREKESAGVKAAWIGSREGISDGILQPWTPLSVERSGGIVRVCCWGRTYEFGSQPFPRAVVTRGESVLRAPVRAAARADGQLQRWKGSPPRLIEARPDRVRLSQKAEAPALILTAETQVEYDGMMRIDWRIEPRQAVRLEELTFEVPLRVKNAKYLYYYPHYERSWSEHLPGELPPEGFVDDFRPVMWLGDDERGLEWFAESDENWFSDEPDRVTEVKREADRVTLRLRLVRVPVELAPDGARKSLSYTFGFQATPVKPVETDALDQRTFHISQSTFGPQVRLDIPESTLDELAAAGVRTIAFHEHWTDIEAHTQTAYGEQAQRLARECHERRMQLLLYFGFLMSDLAPEWEQFSDLCLVEPREGYDPYNYPPQPLQRAFKVCYRSVWQDFLADGTARVMDEYDVDGVYLDGTADPFGGCRNQRHGCGYLKPDGSVGATYAIFPIRSMMRRIYTIVKQRKPQGQVNLHQSAFMVMPALAWATSYWDGEHLAGRPPGRIARETLSLDGFRTEFMGRQWGVPAEFLAYSQPFNYRQAWGLALLHDISVRPIHMGEELELASRVWKVFDEFGRKEAEWVPYWQNAGYVAVRPEQFVASLYRHPKNGVLIEVFNTGQEQTSGSVRLDLKTLGLGGALSVKDALTGEPVAASGASVPVPLGSLEWRLFWARCASASRRRGRSGAAIQDVPQLHGPLRPAGLLPHPRWRT
jgi:hypothetical protein